MIQSWKKISHLLLNKDRKRLVWLLLPMSLTALINVFGIALMMPFLSVVSEPGIIKTNASFLFLYNFLNFTDVRQFSIALGFLAFMMLILTNSFATFTTWVSSRVVADIRARISQTLYAIYLDKPYEFHLNHNSSTLVNNLFQLTASFTNGFILQGMVMLTNIISIVAITSLILIINPLMAFIALLTMGGAFGVLFYSVKRTLASGGALMVMESEAGLKLAQESFGGIKDIKLKGSESVFKSMMFPRLKAMNRFSAFQQMLLTMPRYGLEIIAFGGVIGMVLTMLVAGKTITNIVPIVAVYVYAGYRLMPAMQSLFQAIGNIKVAQSSLDKVYDSIVANKESLEQVESASKTHITFAKMFQLSGLSYVYPGFNREVLKNINLKISHNEIVGIIGETGSGKTTLIDIVLGLLEPTNGAISIDGVVLNNQSKVAAWQSMVGYVPQHIYLSDNSIADNIAFGEDPSKVDRQAVIEAAKVAAIHDFIDGQLESGYDTMVGERGIKLSGGQIQRIGIARALYRNPKVLILDEATSSLDNQTEGDVMQAIYNMRNKMTMIIVAHRLSTLACCDRVLLLKNGVVADEGKLSELSTRHKGFDLQLENIS